MIISKFFCKGKCFVKIYSCTNIIPRILFDNS